MKNRRHAYLIIAHNQFDLLAKLISLIDDKRNDIFIHIDKKASGFNQKYFESLVKYSNIYFTERTDARWGDYSLINAEFVLLKEATLKEKYAYYHLLSGCDLPLKTQDYIHDFFDKIDGKEVVQLTTDKVMKEKGVYYRISRYHFFTREFKNNNFLFKNFNKLFNLIVMPAQRVLHIDRLHKKVQIGYGAQWFSITDEFARYVISKEDWVKRIFSHSRCGDELFLQTILVNSKYKDRVYAKPSSDFNGFPSLRYIDWEKGNPYVFREEDYTRLMESYMLFARKFDLNVDGKIIDKIYNELNSMRGER